MLEHLSAGTNTIISNCINLKTFKDMKKKSFWGAFVFKALTVNTYLELSEYLFDTTSFFIEYECGNPVFTES